MVSNLRDVLLSSLSSLPGTRTFHLHVLTSSPRKHTSLYPYATTRPRVFAQDIFVLLSEQRNNNNNNTESESESKSPRVFVSAIEASVFTIPQTRSAVFYVSKVDSTGQGQRPAPTSTLVRALLKFYIDPKTRPVPADRIWVHLFARAQAQYLFPNSAEYEGKKPLGDVKLCSWWKKVFESVVKEVEKGREGGGDGEPKMFFVLPGMNELEALQALGELSTIGSSSDSAQPKWTYGHPYSQTDIPLPYVVSSKEKEKRYNLGQFIPSFEDDPKARFMDEIACTSKVDGVASPKRKKRRTSDEGSGNGEGIGSEEKGKERVHGELGMVETDEFWERMSFRQECVAGAVTGFFVGIYPWSSMSVHGSTAATSSSTNSSSSTASGTATATVTSSLPGAQPGQVSYQMIRRIVSSLMTGYEFSTRERCEVGTEKLEGVIKGLCEGLPVQEGEATETDDGSVGHKRGHESVSSSSSSLDTYFSNIYGRVRVDNNKDMTEKGKGEEEVVVVRVLSVRKKVRRK